MQPGRATIRAFGEGLLRGDEDILRRRGVVFWRGKDKYIPRMNISHCECAVLVLIEITGLKEPLRLGVPLTRSEIDTSWKYSTGGAFALVVCVIDNCDGFGVALHVSHTRKKAPAIWDWDVIAGAS